MRRMVSPFRLLLLHSLVLVSAVSYGQTSTDKSCKPPIGRVLWHDRIDREQRNALRADGRADDKFQAGDNEDVSYYVTLALTQKMDALQCAIEKDSATGDQKKKTYLLGMENILKNFSALYKKRQFNASHLPGVIELFGSAMAKDIKGESIEDLMDKAPFDVANLAFSSRSFDRNPAAKAVEFTLFKKYCIAHPDEIFTKLNSNPNVPFRDSLIILAGYKNPKRLYDFAAANNTLGIAIRKIDDPFIRAVSKMATSGGSGQLYFPFLDDIVQGKQTLEEIDAVKNDDVKYYKLLVKTRMNYVDRQLGGEKIMEMEALNNMLYKKANDVFIKEINGLHESPDAVRFKILNQLTAQELYYVAIAGETELYTSSFVKGVYPLMMQKIGNRGDSLLMSVEFDRFKKFIKMAAGYNQLSNFLGSFPDKEKAEIFMTAFVNNLEKSTGLEDGVDVADSYASIYETNKQVASEMLTNVKVNYERMAASGNKRGMVMYDLLYKLFTSADSSKTVDLSQEFHIPPVYNVNYKSLTVDSTNKVVIQVFFYGDKDGKMNFNEFVPMFSGGNWKKIEDNKYWVAFASTKGKPVLFYANKPLDEETQEGEVEKAQAALSAYLDEKSMQPTIIIHRGHSYYAPYTIEQIPPTAKVVFLGSCGGYHLIHDVLKHSSDAHIIASKQIGKLNINKPFIKVLSETLRNGNNIDWIPFWQQFKSACGNIDGFEDYIPPYKNLGALFIKAYGSAMGESEDAE